VEVWRFTIEAGTRADWYTFAAAASSSAIMSPKVAVEAMMATSGGVFQLYTAADLFKKLQWEFSSLKQDPANAFVAFNFFVTAEHLVDWVNEEAGKKHVVRHGDALLEAISHIANAGKHFRLQDARHVSVASPHGLEFSLQAPNTGPHLFVTVELQGEARRRLGERVRAVDLADNAMQFWAAHFINGSDQP